MTVEWLMVIPAVDPIALNKCMRTLRVDPARVIVVNNSPHELVMPWEPGQLVDARTNLGVARSWNIGAQRVIDEGADLLIMCSTSCRFGAAGGQDLIDQLDQANEWGIETIDNGWHLVGFTRATLELVGLFDDGFWPAYFEDTDYLYRMGLAGVNSPRENGRSQPYVRVDVDKGRNAQALVDGLVSIDMGAIERRYVAKWGGKQGSERFRTPWNL